MVDPESSGEMVVNGSKSRKRLFYRRIVHLSERLGTMQSCEDTSPNNGNSFISPEVH